MRRLLSIVALALIALTSMGTVSAYDEGRSDSRGGYDRDDRKNDDRNANDREDRDNLGRDKGRGEVRYAVSYINPDTGAATANPDVDPNSECTSPDQTDTQKLSPAGTRTNNVHNDACLFDKRGNDVDAPVSWESYGVGVIAACPDPDGAGPKVAVLTGNRCFQSGFQTTGMAGDGDYHIRLNNDSTPGRQDVAFCFDPENNGCFDAKYVSYISIDWVA